MSLGRIRLAAVLLPAALLLHQGAYALAAPAAPGGHGYLGLALPVLVAVAASLAIASVLGPAVLSRPGGRDRGPSPSSPVLIASALVAIFAGQELVEALLLGGGPAALGAALASASLLLPLALLLGLLCAAAIELLGWAGLRLAELVGGRARRRGRESGRARPRPGRARSAPLSPLAFGLARRPPPAAA